MTEPTAQSTHPLTPMEALDLVTTWALTAGAARTTDVNGWACTIADALASTAERNRLREEQPTPLPAEIIELARRIVRAASVGMRKEAEDAIDSIIEERDALRDQILVLQGQAGDMAEEIERLREQSKQAERFGIGEFRVATWAYEQAIKAYVTWKEQRAAVLELARSLELDPDADGFRHELLAALGEEA